MLTFWADVDMDADIVGDDYGRDSALMLATHVCFGKSHMLEWRTCVLREIMICFE